MNTQFGKAGVALVVGLGIWAGPANAAPKIEFDRTQYDFGTTSGVTSVTGTFMIKNAGDAELVISKPTTSCGCTVAGVKPDKLSPGESGELTFTLTVGRSRGPFQKHITVPSNDPENARVNLAVRVDMLQIYEVTPQMVALGDVRAGSSTNVVVTVRRTDGKPLEARTVGVQGSRLKAEVKPVEGDANAAEIHITAEIGEGLGSFNEQVQVFCGDAGQPAVVISVMGRQVGDLVVAPEKLYWGIPDVDRLPAARVEQLLTRNIRVSGTVPNQPLELKAVHSDLKDLDLQVVTIEPSKTFQIIAKLAKLPTESSKGTITLETNLASVPTVEVPVQITVVRRQ